MVLLPVPAPHVPHQKVFDKKKYIYVIQYKKPSARKSSPQKVTDHLKNHLKKTYYDFLTFKAYLRTRGVVF